MMLRWETDEFGDWHGYSGTLRAAVAHKAYDGQDRWRWAMGPTPAAERDGMADTPEAARAAAEAAWGEWCRTAGLAPVVWRTMDTAPRDGTRILAHCDDGTQAVMRFEPTAYTEPVWVCDAYEPASQIPEAWMPLPPPPPEAPASGMVPPYKAGEGDGA